MNRTLRDHILVLEHRIQALSNRLTDPSCPTPELDRLKADLHFAERALGHYREAFELEQKVLPLSFEPPWRSL